MRYRAQNSQTKKPRSSQAARPHSAQRGGLPCPGPGRTSSTRVPTLSTLTDAARATAWARSATPGRCTRQASSGRPSATKRSSRKAALVAADSRPRGGRRPANAWGSSSGSRVRPGNAPHPSAKRPQATVPNAARTGSSWGACKLEPRAPQVAAENPTKPSTPTARPGTSRRRPRASPTHKQPTAATAANLPRGATERTENAGQATVAPQAYNPGNATAASARASYQSGRCIPGGGVNRGSTAGSRPVLEAADSTKTRATDSAK
jgi:hypothetical protein